MSDFENIQDNMEILDIKNKDQPNNDRQILVDKKNTLQYNQDNQQSSQKNENPFSKSIQIDEENISDYLQVLEEHQFNCQKDGNYVEAEMAKQRIIELKQQFFKKQKEQLRQKHINEKVQIEQAHLNEFTQFNEYWDKKMEEFNQQASQLEQETIQRHQQDSQEFFEELEKCLPQKSKDTPEILNLRKIQLQLAKQQNYMEAHQVQQQCLALEKESFEKWQNEREIKFKNLSKQLEARQQNELDALKKRIQNGSEQQRKVRSIELERLLQKYQNVKQELETQQRQELLKMDKELKQLTNQRTKGSLMINKKSYDNSRRSSSRIQSQQSILDKK